MSVSDSEMRIFRQGQGNQETTRLRGDVACHVAQVIPQIDKHANVIGRIGEIDHLWMETIRHSLVCLTIEVETCSEEKRAFLLDNSVSERYWIIDWP